MSEYCFYFCGYGFVYRAVYSSFMKGSKNENLSRMAGVTIEGDTSRFDVFSSALCRGGIMYYSLRVKLGI
jgi:hypothetical protein